MRYQFFVCYIHITRLCIFQSGFLIRNRFCLIVLLIKWGYVFIKTYFEWKIDFDLGILRHNFTIIWLTRFERYFVRNALAWWHSKLWLCEYKSCFGFWLKPYYSCVSIHHLFKVENEMYIFWQSETFSYFLLLLGLIIPNRKSHNLNDSINENDTRNSDL